MAIHASAAASRGTTSSAVRPDGKLSVTTSTHGGRDSGARFWKKNSPVDAVRVADEHVRPPAGAAQRAVGDGEVVAHEIELGDARLRKQHLARVRDRDLAARDDEPFVFGLRTPKNTAPASGARRRSHRMRLSDGPSLDKVKA